MNPIQILSEMMSTINLGHSMPADDFLPLLDILLENGFPDHAGLMIGKRIHKTVHLLSGYIYPKHTFHKLRQGNVTSTPYIVLSIPSRIVLSRMKPEFNIESLEYEAGTEFQNNVKIYFVLGSLNGRHFLTDFNERRIYPW